MENAYPVKRSGHTSPLTNSCQDIARTPGATACEAGLDQPTSSAEKPALRKCSSAVSACEILRSFITQKLRQSTNE